MKTLQSGLILIGVAISLLLFGYGLQSMTRDNIMSPLALAGMVFHGVAYAIGALGIYRMLVGALVHGTAHPAAFTIDHPTPSVLRYAHGERVMIVTLDFQGARPRLFESAIRGWEPPYHTDQLDVDERKAILQNIIQYLAAHKPGEVEVVPEARVRAA